MYIEGGLLFEVIVEIDGQLIDGASKLIRVTCGKMRASSGFHVCLPLPLTWSPFCDLLCIQLGQQNRRTNTRTNTPGASKQRQDFEWKSKSVRGFNAPGQSLTPAATPFAGEGGIQIGTC